MIDFILAGLSAGLFAFFSLFVVSFVTIGLVTGVIHVVTLIVRSLFADKRQYGQEQTV